MESKPVILQMEKLSLGEESRPARNGGDSGLGSVSSNHGSSVATASGLTSPGLGFPVGRYVGCPGPHVGAQGRAQHHPSGRGTVLPHLVPFVLRNCRVRSHDNSCGRAGSGGSRRMRDGATGLAQDCPAAVSCSRVAQAAHSKGFRQRPAGHPGRLALWGWQGGDARRGATRSLLTAESRSACCGPGPVRSAVT